jgi:mannose-1-phosphate guanylyltransferase
LILNENEFNQVINQALEYTANHKALLTLGIKPSRPETGYGYIQIQNSHENKPV